MRVLDHGSFSNVGRAGKVERPLQVLVERSDPHYWVTISRLSVAPLLITHRHRLDGLRRVTEAVERAVAS